MVELDDIIIDPEFRDLLPAMDRRTELAEKIKAEGWSDEPITVWLNHSILLDGHNRYAIWRESVADNADGPAIRELKFDSREEAMLWVVKNQRSRRNLTEAEDRYLLGLYYKAEKKVKGGQQGNKGNRRELLPEKEETVPSRHGTSERIAKELGIGHAKVERAEQYSDALKKLDERGVINKSDLLSGKVKAPISRVIQAAKAATKEDARGILAQKKDTLSELARKEKEGIKSARKLPSRAQDYKPVKTGEHWSLDDALMDVRSYMNTRTSTWPHSDLEPLVELLQEFVDRFDRMAKR